MDNHFYNAKAVIYLLAMVFIASGCNNKNQKGNKLEKPSDSDAYIVVDSIVLAEPLMFLKDKKGSELIFVRHTNQDILLYNEVTETSHKTNKFGQVPFSIKTPISENIGFFSEDIFWLSDVGNIKKFDLKGNFVEQLDVKSVNEYTPLRDIYFKDGYILALEIPVGFTNEYAYYNKNYKLFVKHQIENQNQTRFFDFPPKDSKFFTYKYYLAYNVFFYINYLGTTSATYLYSVEPIIYTVNLEKETISKKAEFSPEYFSPLKVYFKDKPDNNRIFMQAYMGSVFTGHFIVDKINYVFYNIPYSEEFMVEFVKTHKNFPFEDAPEIKFALTIFDNDGKKLRDDLVLPTSLGKPLLMDDNGIIYFMKNPTEYDEKMGQTVYYKVRLTDEGS